MKIDNIIVLHKDEDNKTIVIDIDKISAMYSYDNYTQIYIDNWCFSVKEDIKTILNKIKNHRGD